MLCISTELKNAEKTKRFLLKEGLYAPGHKVKKEKEKIFFPIKKKLSKTQEKNLGVKITYANKRLATTPTGRNLKKTLEENGFSKKDLEKMVFSFDTVGDIAIIDVPKGFSQKKKKIGATLRELNPRLKTVLCKKSAMRGNYRIRELELVTGEKNTVADYRESGVRMKVDLATCFFSPRLGTERMRIAAQVEPGENVLVLFAGVGPFNLVIGKKQPGAKSVGVEWNAAAVKFFEENIGLNKLEKRVEAVGGDVREVVPQRFENWADRIVMPSPHTAHSFLDVALVAAKPGAIIHYYGFEKTREREKRMKEDVGNEFIIGGEGKVLVAPVEKVVKAACKKAGKKCRILRKKTMRPYAPGVEQKVVDFLIV